MSLFSTHSSHPFPSVFIFVFFLSESDSSRKLRNGSFGYTTFHSWVWQGLTNVDTGGIEQWSDINSDNDVYKRRPIHHAAYFGYVSVLKMLLHPRQYVNSAGTYENRTPASIVVSDALGWNVLHEVCDGIKKPRTEDNVAALEYLLDEMTPEQRISLGNAKTVEGGWTPSDLTPDTEIGKKMRALLQAKCKNHIYSQ